MNNIHNVRFLAEMLSSIVLLALVWIMWVGQDMSPAALYDTIYYMGAVLTILVIARMLILYWIKYWMRAEEEASK